jgi:hypothetical protein
MTFREFFGVPLAILTLLTAAALGQDQASSPPVVPPKAKYSSEFSGYIRIRKDGKKRPVALETSITRFEGVNAQGQPVAVDLIGVVHVGEPEYYESLNLLFEGYDSVLYELVAPEGTRIPKGGRIDEGLNPIAALQNGLKSVLDLEFQLDHIDYTKQNFVHADMSPDEFLACMTENEESFGKYFLRAIGQSIAQQNSGQINQADLLLSVFADDPVIEMRRLMAKQMKDIEGGMLIFQGKNGSTIITHRNKKALSVLRKQVDAGKAKLAIFYGAGHMPEMQRQLAEDFQMRRGGRTWLVAWKLRE